MAGWFGGARHSRIALSSSNRAGRHSVYIFGLIQKRLPSDGAHAISDCFFLFREGALVLSDLRDWLAGQHPGLRTYKSFREKALQLCATDAQHRALYRLLANLAGHYVATFDEEPLPVDVASHAYDVFLDLVEQGDRSIDASVEQQLATLNRIAVAELF
jgi:hypothetical protein